MNRRQYKKYQKKHHYKHWAQVKALEKMRKLFNIHSNIVFENIKEQILNGSKYENSIYVKRSYPSTFKNKARILGEKQKSGTNVWRKAESLIYL